MATLAEYYNELSQKDKFTVTQFLNAQRSKGTRASYATHLRNYFGFFHPHLLEVKRLEGKKREKVFPGNLHSFRRTFRLYRKRMAHKLQNPRLLKLNFHAIRHWKATMEYHRTKDLLYIKELLGHRDIKTTLIYTQLIDFEDDEYHSAVARSIEEARKLIESGFEYICTYNDVMLFRKRK